MNKAKILKIINLLLALLFLWVAGTAIFHTMIPYEVFKKLHPMGGYLFVLLAIIHLILNGAWIKNSFFKTKSR